MRSETRPPRLAGNQNGSPSPDPITYLEEPRQAGVGNPAQLEIFTFLPGASRTLRTCGHIDTTHQLSRSSLVSGMESTCLEDRQPHHEDGPSSSGTPPKREREPPPDPDKALNSYNISYAPRNISLLNYLTSIDVSELVQVCEGKNWPNEWLSRRK